jgi:hypothetical protein
MEELLTILIILAIVFLLLGIVKKLFHLAVGAGIVLVIAAIMTGALTIC